MAGPANLSPTQQADAEAVMENSRQKAIAHTEVAEKTYPQVLQKYDQLQSTGLAEPERMAQALRDVGGVKADELARDIALDLDKINFLNAGNRVPGIKNALTNAGLDAEAASLMRDHPNIRIAKKTRDKFHHPEQRSAGVGSDEYPKVAKGAEAEIEQFTQKLQALSVTPEQQPGVNQALGELGEMKKDFGQFNKPDGYRLSGAADLTRESVETATHLQEIQAGNYAKNLKLAARNLGYQVDSVTLSDGITKNMLPETSEASKALNALTDRRDDLSHLDVKAENPGAIARAKDGTTLLEQLPKDSAALQAGLEKPQMIQLSHVPEAANDPVYNQPSAKAAAPTQPASAAAEAAPAVTANEAAAATKLSSVGQLGRDFGPLAVGIGGVVEAGIDGYTAYSKGNNATSVASATAQGAAKGVFNATFPGASEGYRDITGEGKSLTGLDRALNATSDVSGTTAVTASGVALAGVETGPFDLGPAVVAGGAAIVNIGANLAKAGVKWTGMAGPDQDGGYVYDGVNLAYAGLQKGASWTADKIDGMIFGGQEAKQAPTQQTPASELVTESLKSVR